MPQPGREHHQHSVSLATLQHRGNIRLHSRKNLQPLDQPFTAQSGGINAFGSSVFPGITIADDFGNESPANTNFVFNAGANIGSTAASQGAFTGIFQNRWMPSVDASWIHGRHTITFGGSFSYTQLNARDRRTNSGMIGFTSFDQFLTGNPHHVHSGRVHHHELSARRCNRYYRSKESGGYIQDKYQIRPNLSVTAGVRFDYHGGLIEKNGRIFNFDPSGYSYDAATDTITSNGLIIAATIQTSPPRGSAIRLLTGSSGGIASTPRMAWSPKLFNDKIVVRAGWGLYYDRGETLHVSLTRFASG